MPEGHTIFRTAATLDAWLRGRQVTAARSTSGRVAAHTLVGQTVERVEPRGKHLLVRFSGGAVLHTHLRMTGSWHVYRAGERWKKPAGRARFVLEVAPDRLAVCFDAAVVELLNQRGEHLHPSLTGLGPDVLDPPVDGGEVRRRAAAFAAPDASIGEVLLDQRVVSGIGNIWRAEVLFAERIDPFRAWSSLAASELDAVVTTASALMVRSVREHNGRPPGAVYRRTGRPCPRCGTAIAGAPLGRPPRTVYWCPACQAARRPGPEVPGGR